MRGCWEKRRAFVEREERSIERPRFVGCERVSEGARYSKRHYSRFHFSFFILLFML